MTDGHTLEIPKDETGRRGEEVVRKYMSAPVANAGNALG